MQTQPKKTRKSYGFNRTARVASLARRIGWLQIRGQKEEAAATLVNGLYEMGGIYVKFLQMIANLAPEFPGLTPEIKQNVFTNAPGVPVNVHAALADELGIDYRSHFEHIDDEPLASGSFAVVYRGQLVSGQDVVIKVLRPNLDKQLKTDLRLIGVLARGAQPAVRANLIDLVAMYKNYKEAVLHEIDYPSEARNAELIRKQNTDNELVVIPKTYLELSGKQILVQDYLEGSPLSDYLHRGLDASQVAASVKADYNSDFYEQIENLGVYLLQTGAKGPYTHGDPHPGNVIIMSGNRVGLIDFGIILPRYKNPYAIADIWDMDYKAAFSDSVDITEHIVRIFKLYSPDVFRALEKISNEVKAANPQVDIVKEFRDIVTRLSKPHHELFQKDLDKGLGLSAQTVLKTVNTDNRFNIRVDEDVARIARTQMHYWKSVANLKLLHEMSPRVHKRVRRFVKSNTELFKPAEDTTLNESVRILTDWFQEMYERDPLLFGQLFAKIRESLNNHNQELSNA